MGLKQSIVVVNEYSVPQPGGGGSRGGTPGSYVDRYMARPTAVESLAPIQRQRTDDFIMRYMARENAVERAGATKTAAKEEMRQAQGKGGVAFGYGSVSLSDDQLRAASKDIQRLFDSGHTVLKTVLSFDQEYLKEQGLVDPDFVCTAPGDYRGHLDQLKLRMAIMHGLERMASGPAGRGGFDDLRFVGVVQVDTEHVHAHLAMVDAGPGRRTRHGHQSGMLGDRHKSRLRRGIDGWLREKQAMHHLSSAVGYERRNVVTFVKRWAHEQIRTETLPQFLLACLPQDRSLWRAGSNAASMRKANTLVTELVEETLARPGSPMPAAMGKVVDYANDRTAREGLSVDERERLVSDGRRQIVERAVNGVYQMLATLPAAELTIRTPMLSLMGMDYEQMALMAAERGVRHQEEDEEADLVRFGFRLRSYASRAKHHREKAGFYREMTSHWEKANQAGVAHEDSRALYDFYRFEEDYHARVVSKYHHFLPFLGDTSQWVRRHEEVTDYGQHLLALTAMRGDASLQRMKDEDEAERIGQVVYDQNGGGLLTRGAAGRAILDSRLSTMRETYTKMQDELVADLSLAGLSLEPVELSDQDEVSQAVLPGELEQPQDLVDAAGGQGQGQGQGGGGHAPVVQTQIVVGPGHRFEDVKGLDLHHLGYDFTTDVAVGSHVRATFIEATRTRRNLLVAAMDYLDASDQSHVIEDLPVDDVAAMAALAADLSKAEPDASGAVLMTSQIALLRQQQEQQGQAARRSAATSLDAGLGFRVRRQVDQAVLEMGLGEFPKAEQGSLEEPRQMG